MTNKQKLLGDLMTSMLSEASKQPDFMNTIGKTYYRLLKAVFNKPFAMSMLSNRLFQFYLINKKDYDTRWVDEKFYERSKERMLSYLFFHYYKMTEEIIGLLWREDYMADFREKEI